MKIVAGSRGAGFVSHLSKSTEVFRTQVHTFADGELHVRLPSKTRLQGEVVLVVQSLCEGVNDAFIELLFCLDVVRSLGARAVFLLIPYLGYSRQDRIREPTEALSSKIILKALSQPFIRKIFTIQLHTAQAVGFPDIPCVNFTLEDFLYDVLKKNYSSADTVLISPDAGNAEFIITLASALKMESAVAVKYRPAPNDRSAPNETSILAIGGADVKGRTCIILDDIVDSAGTLCSVAAKLQAQGAAEIVAYVTHPVLSPQALERLPRSALSRVFVSDTIESAHKRAKCPCIQTFSLAEWCFKKIEEWI
jgi:ribose-phosphate pyrophosphokinase